MTTVLDDPKTVSSAYYQVISGQADNEEQVEEELRKANLLN